MTKGKSLQHRRRVQRKVLKNVKTDLPSQMSGRKIGRANHGAGMSRSFLGKVKDILEDE